MLPAMADSPPLSVPEPEPTDELVAALAKHCPGGAVLVRINADGSLTQLVAPRPLNARELFGTYMTMACLIGQTMGLKLDWLQVAKRPTIEVPRGLRGKL